MQNYKYNYSHWDDCYEGWLFRLKILMLTHPRNDYIYNPYEHIPTDNCSLCVSENRR